eukprot:5559289-Pleurochrysis_carterae.AAC.1
MPPCPLRSFEARLMRGRARPSRAVAFVAIATPEKKLLGPCGRHQYGVPLRSWRYERAARQRGACFEA